MVNLFVIPFAGGSRYSYNAFKKHLSPEIEFHALEYPGRGGRLNEPLLYKMDDLVEDMAGKIYDHRERAYAIFGHSLGALVGCMMIRRLLAMGVNTPLLFVASGNDAPSCCEPAEPIHLKSHKDFMESIRSFGAPFPEMFEQPALVDFFEPILRADLQVYETFSYQASEPLTCPAFILSGTDDSTCSRHKIDAWQNEFGSPVRNLLFNGDHFFIFRHAGPIARLLSEEILLQKKMSLAGVS